jgi:hypothetical protein
MIVTAAIFPGGGTGFKKLPPVAAQKQMLFAGRQTASASVPQQGAVF